MAQKKRKEAEKKEEYEWTPPDFNEREFLEKDIRTTRILLVTAMISVLCGIAAFAVTGINWVVGFGAIIAGAIALRFIYPFFKIDVKSIEKKTWASNIILFMFMALGIWILLLNPPFSDHTDPSVSDIHIWVNNGGTWTELTTTNAATLINQGELVNITVTASDISGIDTVEISVYPANQAGSFQPMNNTVDDDYSFISNYAANGASSQAYFFLFRATDSTGHTYQTTSAQFVVNP